MSYNKFFTPSHGRYSNFLNAFREHPEDVRSILCQYSKKKQRKKCRERRRKRENRSTASKHRANSRK